MVIFELVGSLVQITRPSDVIWAIGWEVVNFVIKSSPQSTFGQDYLRSVF